jgi:GTP1/Obg family GTP-binding protein
MAPGFQQATIKVENEMVFSELRAAIDRVFTAPEVEKFLRELKKKDVGVRDFDAVLAGGFIERADAALAKAAKTAKKLWESLPLSDQSQIKEFYLVRLEQVDVKWRAKFATVYRVL